MRVEAPAAEIAFQRCTDLPLLTAQPARLRGMQYGEDAPLGVYHVLGEHYMSRYIGGRRIRGSLLRSRPAGIGIAHHTSI